MRIRFDRQAIVLGLLAAVGPFAIDMYLPAFPAMADSLHTNIETIPLSLTSYFTAMAIAQIFYGPLSDMLGRKVPLYAGLLLYVLAAIACALSTSIGMLIVFRFVQGLGGCAAAVITRAVVRDLYTGPAAAKLLALIMLVFSVSPLLAPLSGTVLAVYASWRWIFVALAVIGMIAMVLAVFALPETLPKERRTRGRMSVVFRNYGSLLIDKPFMLVALIGGLPQAALLAYLGGSAEVYQEHYGLSETTYSLLFACNAVGIIGAAQCVHVLLKYIEIRRLVLLASIGLVICSGGMAGLIYAGVDHWWVISGGVFSSFCFVGLLVPSTTVLALDPHGKIAGIASSLLGTIQLGSGAVAIALVSVLADGTAVPLVSVFFTCGAMTCVLALLEMSQPEPVPDTPALSETSPETVPDQAVPGSAGLSGVAMSPLED